MVSSHMTRIAEIEIESVAEVSALGLRERVLAEASQRGVEHSDVGWVPLYAFRRRLEEGLRRLTTLEAGEQPTLAIGFVDLVDFHPHERIHADRRAWTPARPFRGARVRTSSPRPAAGS